MALDRAIQVARDLGHSPPTLRLYRWTRPTVTLGRFQNADAVDRGLCRTLGVDVVRRFTGGRGVLHDDEVTYCVVASVGDGVPRGTSASYRHLSQALAATYARLGVEADLVPREGGVRGSAACYLHSTAADLSLDGRKLSGSAQVWLHDTVMQHGSFVLTRDVAREAAVFGLEPEEAERLAGSTVTLADRVSRPVDIDDVIEAAIGAFGTTFQVVLEPGAVTAEERALAADLIDAVRIENP
jgi:lipoate-protein ligase A